MALMSMWSSKATVNSIDIAVNVNNKWIRLWEAETDKDIYLTYELAKQLASVLSDLTKDDNGS